MVNTATLVPDAGQPPVQVRRSAGQNTYSRGTVVLWAVEGGAIKITAEQKHKHHLNANGAQQWATSPAEDSYRAGLRGSVPMLFGVLPFGMISGAVAVQAGLTPLEAMGMSILVYAGASQLAALQLLMAGAPVWLAVLTAGIVNLRFLMYSAALAPYFRPLSWGRKLVYAYLLTDQGAILSLNHYGEEAPQGRGRYYFSLALALWLAWQVGTGIGIYLGARTPESGALGFIVPMVFLSVLIPNLRGRPALTAALVAATVSIIGLNLPMNLGLIAASLAGIAAGVLAEEFNATKSVPEARP